MLSYTEENYIKCIYQISENASKKQVSSNEIADNLQTTAASVSDMLKKLTQKALINYTKYKGVSLTDEGMMLALQIVRKHRLWEVFLVEKLNFSWDEVHDVAEQLEHIQSPKLIQQLDNFLGFPTQDPHGDPIPDKDGNLKIIEKRLLSALGKNESGICIGVDDSSSEFLQFLDKRGITLGKHIKVLEKEAFDDSLIIEINQQKMTISKKIANNLYIQKS